MKLEFSSEGSVELNNTGIIVRDLLASLTLAKNKLPLGIHVKGKVFDLETFVDTSVLKVEADESTDKTIKSEVLYLEDDTDKVKLIYRHSMSHVLAQAVRRLYPNVKLAIGPATEEGFYYDFDTEVPFTVDDLRKISDEMDKIIKEAHPFVRSSVTSEEALKVMNESGEIYKTELIEQIKGRGENMTFYTDGDFVDLCAGPHVPKTSTVKQFKLLEVAGAYWRGSEKNKMLQRIYGTAFLKKEDLKAYLTRIEEAKKRDHRRLGKDLDLFSTKPDTVGGGLVLWHPKGGLVRYLIEDHCKKKHLEGGYDFVFTPHIGKSTLWETSGHLEFYKDGMYAPIDIEGQEYYLKPMNCPFHVQIFASKMRSYRDLPIRFAEWGTVYRFERSGTLHGLTRVRGFTQDDAHLFCRPDQMPAEIDKVLNFSLSLLRDFGFTEFNIKLSTRPEERVGDESRWDAAEDALRQALVRSQIDYTINEGDGAFYGPKIDICVKDAIGREWQLSTIQFDFNLPERFDISFIGDDGKQARPYMLHRALLGSMERFFGVLVEHYGGAFPMWLAPEQLRILPIAEKHQEYGNKVKEFFANSGFRVSVDNSSNTLSYRVRAAQAEKIPYVIVLGEKECETETVSIRRRGGLDVGVKSLREAVTYFEEEVKNKDIIEVPSEETAT